MNELTIGAAFRCETAPELLPSYARTAETLGYDEFWVIEDCFWSGAIAGAAQALAATRELAVGIGIAPAVMRNAAVTAMEFATLSRLYPGRLLPGLGHGVGAWMKQIGALPVSQLAALEETTVAVRRLLAGDTVTMHGRHVNLDEVRLDHQPVTIPPLCLGVTQARSLRLSGRVADGTLLCEPSGPSYVRWAREQIARGQAEAQRTAPHRVTVYAWFGLGAEAEHSVRLELATALLTRENNVQITTQGLGPEVAELVARHPEPAALADALPPAWLRTLAAVGSPQECADSLCALADAGADSVVLMPPKDPVLARTQLDLAARHVLPVLRATAH